MKGGRGTKERKRAQKAVPPSRERDTPMGCVAALLVYVVLFLVLWAKTKHAAFLVVSVPGIAIALYLAGRFLYGRVLLALVRLRWTPRGVACLIIHSESPRWAAHVERHWLPLLAQRAVLLNWSERASWRGSLAVRLFRHFCDTYRNFNPAVVVFRGMRRPLVFRFFYAFQQMHAGRPQYLAELEAQMFSALEVERAAA
jgi:hypothetical protein